MSRILTVDPNNFDDLYVYNRNSMFGDTKYNMSVPPEDLCIFVELTTKSKTRSVLISDANTNIGVNTGGNNNISFIFGTKDQTTGGRRFLTTNYTNVSTQLEPLEECLGITDINIDFNSSHTPIVSISFVDIRGGAIFQSGAKSMYNVLFRLPYPLFKLKVKGYYGQPVVYCLHLTKCTTKFNSQNGNFEISTQFVGYTYALLADMLIGYIKAGARTKRGAELLKDKGTIAINDFMKKANSIDELIKKQLEDTSDQDRNDLARVLEAKQILAEIEQSVDDLYAKFRVNYPLSFDSKNKYIVVVADGNPDDENWNDQKNIADQTSWGGTDNEVERETRYNEKVGNLTDAIFNTDKNITNTDWITESQLYGQNGGIANEDLVDTIKENYINQINTESNEEIQKVIDRLKDSNPSPPSSPTNSYSKYWDATWFIDEVNRCREALDVAEEDLRLKQAQKLANSVSSELGFQANIRNIVKMFTAHIEIFLQLLFEVSSKYQDTNRLNEFRNKFNVGDDVNRLDITDKDLQDGVIYPWPEYIKNGEEDYLGKPGVLQNPLNVPEIQFVEELYEAMVKNVEELQTITQQTSTGPVAWASISPADSLLIIEKKPYDRLPDSANHDDLAIWVSLRAMGFLWFNQYLTDEEITAIAETEGQAIVNKFANNNILKAFIKKYSGGSDYYNIQYRLSETDATTTPLFGVNSNVITLYGGFVYEYKGYSPVVDNALNLYNTRDVNTARTVLPLDKGFLESDYRQEFGAEKDLSKVRLSTRYADIQYTDPIPYTIFWDDARYIYRVTDEYNKKQASPVPGFGGQQTIFSYLGLAQVIDSKEKITEAGGFKLFSGKFGVQEFKKINYDGSPYVGNETNMTFDYLSLFYDDVTLPPPRFISGTILTPTMGFRVTSLAHGKDPTAEKNLKILDISDKADSDEIPLFIDHNPNEERIFRGIKALPYEQWYYDFIKYNENSNIDLGKNVYNFRLVDSRREEITFPYFTYGLNLTSRSLFGSLFYYSQETKTRAFLFLHCFPWRGITNDSNGIFNSNSIRNTFYLRNGLIQTPYLWSVFIGALLWRYDRWQYEKIDVINWQHISGNTNNQVVPLSINTDPSIPKPYEYLKSIEIKDPTKTILLSSPISISSGEYVQLERNLILLPPPIKQNFLAYFEEFVTNDWVELSKIFELGDGNGNSFDANTFVTAWNALGVDPPTGRTIVNNIYNYKSSTSLDFYFQQTLGTIESLVKPRNGGKLSEYYSRFDLTPMVNKAASGPIDDDITSGNIYEFFLEHKKNGVIENKLKELYFKVQWFQNDAPKSFNVPSNIADTNFGYITVKKETFDKYIDALNKPSEQIIGEQEKLTLSNAENYQIKLEIYRTCKKLYDKWIGGTPGSTSLANTYNDIVFQCCTIGLDGTPDRLSGDTARRDHRGDTGEVKMIDSFRFVSRSFKDLGDQFQLNPVFINKILYESSDVSFYDVLSRILTENNFEFIPLPNFINYKDQDDLKQIFRPYPCYLTTKLPITGPAFICVYVGQTSTKLDIKDPTNQYQYPNDGFDIRDDILGVPPDFVEKKQDWEDYAATFFVNYSVQNQNIFKDIRLDQNEFNETAESLQITDAISNRLNTTSGTYIGQNLYNVYSVRSYKVEIEMLGDAMIQPMMYFQLNNIPMFHGAYLITKVRHAIKPNYMSTTFTGTRIKYATTPIVDVNELYSALLEGSTIAPSGGGGIVTGSYPPIVSTIVANGGTNAHLAKSFGQITLEPIGEIEGVRNYKADVAVDTTDEKTLEQYADRLIAEAIPPLKAMLTAFVLDATNNTGIYGSFTQNSKTYYIAITSMYRNEAKQKSIQGDGASKPGFSPHGWGIAVDLQFLDKNGNLIPNDNLWKKGFDTEYNPTLKWLIDNSYKYGFYLPAGLRDGGGTFEEYWHFEYHGTAAPYCWQDYPKVYKNTWSASSLTQDASVVNPKNPDGTVATYTSCKYISIRSGDGIDDTKSTKNLEPQFKANEKIVLDYFKSFGLSREQTAGIMGNIYAESRFNPNPKKYYDTNGKYSYGLIQWNSGSYDTSVIDGQDAAFQVRKITDGFTGGWDEFLSASNSTSGLDADYAAYLFAYYVERCACCRRGGVSVDKQRSEYVAGCTVNGKFYTPVKRSKFANDYYLRFNDPNDPLYWGSVITITTNNTTNNTTTSAPPPTSPTQTSGSIMIGDSLLDCLSKKLSAAGSVTKLISSSQGESSLWQVGKSCPWLINALKKYPVSPSVTGVLISIGSNDGFQNRGNLTTLLTELRRVFPNAKYVFVRGSYGWGGNSSIQPQFPINQSNATQNGSTTYDPQTVKDYYSVLNNSGPNVIVLNQGAGYGATSSEAHSCNRAHYPTLVNEIKTYLG